MLETLADLMFGTPKRFRTSIYAFWIIGAMILLWLYRVLIAKKR